MGGRILIVFGYFENDDLNYFDQLQNFLENIGIKIHLFGWKHQEKLFKKFNIRRYDLLDDPGSVKDINNRYVNINRQIKHWQKVLEIYQDSYIFKIRPDLRFKRKKPNLKKLFNSKDYFDTIKITNVSTVSPRFLNIVKLENHFCDWIISGSSFNLKSFLNLKFIDENNILYKSFKKNKFTFVAKNIQAEQYLFKGKFFDNEDEYSIKIYTLNYLGLNSKKYKLGLKRNFSPFGFISFGGFEACLYNRRKYLFLKFYVPFFRIISLSSYILYSKIILKKLHKIKI